MPQRIEVSGSGNVIVQIKGDGNTVVPHLPHLTLTRYLQRRTIRPVAGQEPEAELVSPYSLSISMLGREPEQKDLWAWMSNGTPVSVRVMVGSGGRGKTRLTLEMCETALEEDWRAGFVTAAELRRFRRQQNVSNWGWNAPTLIVLDYAAGQARALHEWLVELSDNPALGDTDAGKTRPLRILLLERQADPGGGWWMEAFGRGGGEARAVRALLDPPKPIVLPPIEDPAIRRQIIADMMGHAGSEIRPPAVGEDPEFDRKLAELTWGGEPLFLMMAGLAAAKAGFGKVLTLSADELAFEIADRELARIEKIAVASGMAESAGGFARHMAALLTLCEGLHRDATYEVIEREKEATGHDNAGDRATIYEALHRALPGPEGELDPILPDMIGEAAMLRVWGEHDGREVVARMAEQRRSQVTHSVIRACQDFGIHGHKDPLQWLHSLRAGISGPTELTELANALPEQTLELRELAAELTKTITDAARTAYKQEPSKERRGTLTINLSNLSFRLSELGRWEEALAANEEAVEIYQEIDAAKSEDFRPGLADLLNNLSTRLFDLGRQEEALAASKKAVDLYGTLIAEFPDAFRSDLARSLNNMMNQLFALGRLEAASAAGEEAVKLFRALAAARPDAFRPDLANSLSNFSLVVSGLGRRNEALAASQEAAEILQEFAAVRPDAFRPALASSLNNLSNHLFDLNRPDEGLATNEKALKIRRVLADAHPDTFRPDLATSLNNLSARLSELGRREEALATIEEAVEIRRTLAHEHPDAFQPILAGSLVNLSNALAGLDRGKEALAAIEEAADLYRALAAARPDAFCPDLASSSGALSIRLYTLGRWSEALAAVEEAILTLRKLFLRSPRAHAALMAKIVGNYNMLCGAIGKEPDNELLRPIIAALQRLEGSSDDKDNQV